MQVIHHALTGLALGVCVSSASAQQLYATSIDGGLHSIDAVSGAVSFFGATGFSDLAGLDIRGDGGLLGYTRGASSQLVSIDPGTGAGTLIGAFGQGFDFEGGLVIADGSTGYAVGGQSAAGSTAVYSFDPNSGGAVQVGSFDNPDVNGLVMRSDGVLVGWSQFPSNLVTFDPGSGTSSNLATASGLTNSITGGFATFDGNTAYLLATSSGVSGSTSLYRADLYTGELGFVTLVDSTAEFTGLAVPAPASLSLVGFSLAAACRRRR